MGKKGILKQITFVLIVSIIFTSGCKMLWNSTSTNTDTQNDTTTTNVNSPLKGKTFYSATGYRSVSFDKNGNYFSWFDSDTGIYGTYTYANGIITAHGTNTNKDYLGQYDENIGILKWEGVECKIKSI